MNYHGLLYVTLYILTGLLTGLISGVLGIGGGIIVVPALIFIFSHNPLIPASLGAHLAIGSSLAIMISTAFAAVRAHHKHKMVLWSLYRHIAPSLVMGTVIGGLLSDQISTRWLEGTLAVFLLLVALQLSIRQEPTDVSQKPLSFHWFHYILPFFIGLPSGLLGIGGGALLIPYLSYCGIKIKEILALSALCTMTVALFGTLIFILSGLNETALPHAATGYVYWPAVFFVSISSMVTAPLGVKLAYYISSELLKYFFVIILILTSLSLFF